MAARIGAICYLDEVVEALDPASGELWVGTARSGVSVRRASGTWETFTRASTGGGLASARARPISVASWSSSPGRGSAVRRTWTRR